jgi:Tol biopolymer transport system component
LIALAVLISVSIFLIKRQPSTKPLLPQHKQLTFTGNASYPAISPDGKFIAYVNERFEAGERKDTKIIVQDIVSGQAIEVLHVYSCQYLRWLPDSSELSFSAITLGRDIGIFVISPLGGTPRRLSDQDIEGRRGYAWSPDGSQYAWVGENQIHIRSRSTGVTTPMNLNLNESILRVFDIDWSPEGSFMLINTREKERKFAIWTISVDGRKQSKVIEDSVQILYPRWSPRGDSIYYQQEKDFAYQCWKIPVSLNTGEPSKAPLPILPGIQAGRNISVSKNGKVLLCTRLSKFTNLWLASIEGTEKDRTVKTNQLTTGTFTDIYPSISPDGNFIAFSRGTGSISNIYIMPLEGGSPRQITNFKSLNLLAKWSPDGKEIAFGSNEGGTPRVWKVNVKGGSPFQFVKTKSSAWFDLAWSPGPNIIYSSQSSSNFNVLNPITEEESPLLEEDRDRKVFRPRYSPDGKKVAYEQSGGLWVASLENSPTALLKEGNFSPVEWSSDGKWIYVSEPTASEIRILMISVENSLVKTLLSLPIAPGIGELQPYRFSMTPDGKQFVFEASRRFSDVWMVENFDPDVK